ncbi:response regulator [Microbacterium sp. 18062]|uniref:response regulator n=1 Tax=Microbacterium sp. 18062 TaxID=2681410 RepID=UPI001359DAD3|nr:response regulator [Microbacterium sp. 18062]
MALARLSGGPLDGQVLPLEDGVDDSLIVPYGEGQVVYRRDGEFENTGDDDGPTQARFRYIEATEPIDPNPDGRDD